MLLNIDKPLRKATLHTEECSRIPRPVGTDLKPHGRLGRDGGWFAVFSEADARLIHRREFPRAEFVCCSYCIA
jgi:hypothetical protein